MERVQPLVRPADAGGDDDQEREDEQIAGAAGGGARPVEPSGPADPRRRAGGAGLPRGIAPPAGQAPEPGRAEGGQGRAAGAFGEPHQPPALVRSGRRELAQSAPADPSEGVAGGGEPGGADRPGDQESQGQRRRAEPQGGAAQRPVERGRGHRDQQAEGQPRGRGRDAADRLVPGDGLEDHERRDRQRGGREGDDEMAAGAHRTQSIGTGRKRWHRAGREGNGPIVRCGAPRARPGCDFGLGTPEHPERQ